MTLWSEIKCFFDASFSIFEGDNIAVFSDGGKRVQKEIAY